jgi:signal transduction histidine kinase
MNTIESDEYLIDVDAVREDEIQDLANTINNINFQIAELSRIKEALEPRLSSLLNHGEDGSKSYIAGKYKVVITTGFNYTLNKEEYAINSGRLPKCFNFVKQRVAYDIDKLVLKDAEKYASAEELELIATMVSKKAKKLHIKLTAGI